MTSACCDGSIEHKSVLLNEVLRLLAPRPAGTYLDCTLGGAGHALAILKHGGEDVRLIGIDRDEETLRRSRKRLEPYWGRVELACNRFENLKEILSGRKVDGILMDLGVSSFMLDDPERGFSFRHDGPLDMRMDRSQELSAAGVVNGASRDELARIFREYGEERFAGRIASAIVRRREREPFRSTSDLADTVAGAVPVAARRGNIHPATRVFMALRIHVNSELEHLEKAVRDGVEHLVEGGRMLVISFHSLEDRIVKKVFVELSKGCVCPPRSPICVCGRKPAVKLLTRKPLVASAGEVAENPRARSARLRAVERVAA